MRKIETQMNAAVQANQNWTSGNTAVYFDSESGVSVVRLHGNKIAEIDEDSMKLYDGGFQSNTTKSRLNALCDAFGYSGEGVFQKNWTWFVRLWTGTEFHTTEFRNGMRLA